MNTVEIREAWLKVTKIIADSNCDLPTAMKAISTLVLAERAAMAMMSNSLMKPLIQSEMTLAVLPPPKALPPTKIVRRTYMKGKLRKPV